MASSEGIEPPVTTASARCAGRSSAALDQPLSCCGGVTRQLGLSPVRGPDAAAAAAPSAGLPLPTEPAGPDSAVGSAAAEAAPDSAAAPDAAGAPSPP